MRRKHAALALLLCVCLALLCGCGGGQEIESCLFVLAMAVDPAPEGALTVTVKALSGTQETAQGSVSSGSGQPGDESSRPRDGEGGVEQTEPGYIVLSATAPTCLRALSLLSSTTPRTLNLSQLREVVINRTLAQTEATLPILREIYSMYRASGEAVVVVTPDNAGDFIRRQKAILGVRLSKYLEVLFEHFSSIDTIPPHAQLASVIAAMESGAVDAAVVYAAGNDFQNTLMLSGASESDRLPGHLPRTSPAENEYLGSALFSGARMTGVLTGEETGILCLMMGEAQRRTTFIGNAQYKTDLPTRVTRRIEEDGTLSVCVRMHLTRIAGEERTMAGEIARQTEMQMAAVLEKLKAASCDAIGFGGVAMRRYPDIASWESAHWKTDYEQSSVRAAAQVTVR